MWFPTRPPLYSVTVALSLSILGAPVEYAAVTLPPDCRPTSPPAVSVTDVLELPELAALTDEYE